MKIYILIAIDVLIYLNLFKAIHTQTVINDTNISGNEPFEDSLETTKTPNNSINWENNQSLAENQNISSSDLNQTQNQSLDTIEDPNQANNQSEVSTSELADIFGQFDSPANESMQMNSTLINEPNLDDSGQANSSSVKTESSEQFLEEGPAQTTIGSNTVTNFSDIDNNSSEEQTFSIGSEDTKTENQTEQIDKTSDFNSTLIHGLDAEDMNEGNATLESNEGNDNQSMTTVESSVPEMSTNTSQDNTTEEVKTVEAVSEEDLTNMDHSIVLNTNDSNVPNVESVVTEMNENLTESQITLESNITMTMDSETNNQSESYFPSEVANNEEMNENSTQSQNSSQEMNENSTQSQNSSQEMNENSTQSQNSSQELNTTTTTLNEEVLESNKTEESSLPTIDQEMIIVPLINESDQQNGSQSYPTEQVLNMTTEDSVEHHIQEEWMNQTEEEISLLIPNTESLPPNNVTQLLLIPIENQTFDENTSEVIHAMETNTTTFEPSITTVITTVSDTEFSENETTHEPHIPSIEEIFTSSSTLLEESSNHSQLLPVISTTTADTEVREHPSPEMSFITTMSTSSENTTLEQNITYSFNEQDMVNIVTLSFVSKTFDIYRLVSVFDVSFRQFICNLTNTVRTHSCTVENVNYVSPSPLVVNNQLIINFFVYESVENEVDKYHVFPGPLIVEALKNSTKALEKIMEMKIVKFQTNLGTLVVKPLESHQERMAKFELLVFIFTVVMFVCTVLLCLAIICTCAKRKSVDMNRIELSRAGRRQTNGGIDLNSETNIMRDENHHKLHHNVINIDDGWVAPIDHVIENEKYTKYDNLQDTKL